MIDKYSSGGSYYFFFPGLENGTAPFPPACLRKRVEVIETLYYKMPMGNEGDFKLLTGRRSAPVKLRDLCRLEETNIHKASILASTVIKIRAPHRCQQNRERN